MMLLNMPAPAYGHKVLKRIEGEDWNGYQGVGDYSNSNGNTWEVVSAAHEIRNRKHSDVTKNVIEIEEDYDVVIVGGGFSGLGAAHTFFKGAPDDKKCLILDNHHIFGGEAKQNEFDVDGHR